jgi:RNA polymerase sigma-54 factor
VWLYLFFYLRTQQIKNMAIIQTQSQKQTQKLTSQQIQLHNILALPTVALEQYIANEMAINPALEFDTLENDAETPEAEEENPYEQEDKALEGKLGEDYDHTDFMDRESLDDYRYEANNHASADDKREQIYLETHDFSSLLCEQLDLLFISDKEKELGTYLINTLDEDGYLRRKISDIADELSFVHNTFVTEEELEEVLKIIQTLEPYGVGAKSLQECLLIQLERKKVKTRETYVAIKVLKHHMEDLSSKRFDKIRAELCIEQDDFQDALAEIRKLNPRPAGSNKESTRSAITIEPDFSVIVNNNKVELYLNSAKHPPLRISDDYTEMLSNYGNSKDKSLKEASGFIKGKVESAKWFIEALQLREKTMISVGRAIVKHQQKFFLSGDQADLRPLILKTIAEEINSDISTVSRIASSKYIQTEYGTLLIKDLFVEGLTAVNGESVSTNEVKLKLIECVKAEDKSNPLSDEEIARLLISKNYSIARRTVAKYREELNIPSKNFRKVA